MNCIEKNSVENVSVRVSDEVAPIVNSAPVSKVEVDMELGSAVPVQMTLPPIEIWIKLALAPQATEMSVRVTPEVASL